MEKSKRKIEIVVGIFLILSYLTPDAYIESDLNGIIKVKIIYNYQRNYFMFKMNMFFYFLILIFLFEMNCFNQQSCPTCESICNKCPVENTLVNTSPLKIGDYALKTKYKLNMYDDTGIIAIDSTEKSFKVFSFLNDNIFKYNPWNCVGGCGLGVEIPGRKFAGFEGITEEVSGTYNISDDSIFFHFQKPLKKYNYLKKNVLYSAKLKQVSDTHFVLLDPGSLNSSEKYDTVFEREIYMFRSGVTDPSVDTLDCFLSSEKVKVDRR